MPGPPPKRKEQRRRRNKPAEGREVQQVARAGSRVKVPNVKPGWHPLMKDWYRALKASGQAQFFEPSDWQTAQLWCHVMSEELKSGEPIKANTLTAFNSVAGDLLVTEGARRRLRLELQAGGSAAAAADDDGVVSVMESYRKKFDKAL